MTTPTPDTEITIARGELRLTVSPYGASLRGLSKLDGHGEYHEVVTEYRGAAAKQGGEGDVLIPFPGRIGKGKYEFGGIVHQLELTDHEGPNAIHGFLRKTIWDTKDIEEGVRFTTAIKATDHPGYPFHIAAEVCYQLTADGLRITFTITNKGTTAAPVAAGFHPYFTVGSKVIDGDTLTVPFSGYLEFDDTLIPTGKIIDLAGTPFDFTSPRIIGDVKINTCYVNPTRDADGLVNIKLSATDTGEYVTVWMDGAYNYVVLYSGDPLPENRRRTSLAIEPMTCASDAFNHPDWGLVTLSPGESFTGAWGVSPS